MRLIVSTMKDEGPFILEWIAYYLFLGFEHFIINTNDCSDGTDKIIQRLDELGIASHIDNPGPWKRGPQWSAYDNAMDHPKFKQAEWVMVCDADEFLDIKVGDNTLDALFAAAPDADVFAFVWRLFGHNGIVKFEDRFVIEQMTMASARKQVWPVQVRAIKSLFRNDGRYRMLSTHRPRWLPNKKPPHPKWVDGDGNRVFGFERHGWTFSHTGNGFGDELARMNHYAVRSVESYLMKRLRGDVSTTRSHKKLEGSGEEYWRLHCWNVEKEESIMGRLPRVREIFDELNRDPTLKALHEAAVAFHKERISEIRQMPLAEDFVQRFNAFRHGKVVRLTDNVITDPHAVSDHEKFDRSLFIGWMQFSRMREMRNRIGGRLYPWFANFDALQTPTDQDALNAEIEALKTISGHQPQNIPPIPAALQAALDAPEPEPTARQKSQSRKRRAFFAEVTGERHKNWLLVGARDPLLISDLLALPQLNTLYVLEPAGFRPAEHVVNKVVHDPARLAQDHTFFRTVLRYHEELKSRRLRLFRLPPSALKLFPDGLVDVAVIAQRGQKHGAAAMCEMMAKTVRPGGLLICGRYHPHNDRGLAMMQGVHEFLGEPNEAGQRRVQDMQDGHIAIELGRSKPTG